MSELNQHRAFSESDIRRYLAGQLSASEMRAIEMAALDDPFLADAIEGMQEANEKFGEPQVQEKLTAAKELLQERIAEKESGKVIPFYWKRIAVAALLVIIAGGWLYKSFLDSDKTNETLAAETRKAESSSTDSSIARSNNAQNELTVSPDTSGKINTGTDINSAPVTVKKPSSSSTGITQSDAYADEAKSATKNPPVVEEQTTQPKQVKDWAIEKEENKDGKLELRDAAVGNKSAAARSESAPAPKADYLSVKVVDSTNAPISNASIVDLDKKKTYLTDQNGLVKIPASDTIINASISSIGYQSKQLQLTTDQDFNKVQLNAANNLSEVVVVGYGANSKKKEKVLLNRRAPKVMVQDAEPSIGWVEYNKYIDSAKATVNAPISGDVVISFLVNKSGESSGYKIEQSVSKEQDEAALNIVKAGSAWRLLKGKKQRVYVIIHF